MLSAIQEESISRYCYLVDLPADLCPSLMATSPLRPSQILVAFLASWLTRDQLAVIDYLLAENRILRARLTGSRLRLTDGERRRLVCAGRRLGLKILRRYATLVSPEHLFRQRMERLFLFAAGACGIGIVATYVTLRGLLFDDNWFALAMLCSASTVFSGVFLWTFLVSGRAGRRLESHARSISASHLIRAVEILQYLLPKRIRERVFRPAFEELKADHFPPVCAAAANSSAAI